MHFGKAGFSLTLLVMAFVLSGYSSSESAEFKGSESPGKKTESSKVEENPQLLFRTAFQLHQGGRIERAVPLLERFVQKYTNQKNHLQAVFLLADSRYFIAQNGAPAEYEKVVKDYVLAVSLYPRAPQMPRAYFRLGKTYKALNKPAEALVAFRTLLEKAPESPQAPNAILEIASRYLDGNDPKSAIDEYEKILKSYKGTSAEKDAYFGIANALSKQKLFQEALQRFEGGINRWPGYLGLRSDLLYNFAETLFQAGKMAKAERLFLRMININPSNEYAHRALARLGDIELDRGRPENAVKIYMRVVSKYPRTEGAWVSLIRMADMVVDGKFQVRSGLVFPTEPLKDPVGAYRRVAEEASQSRLSHVAYLRIANYYLKRKEFRNSISAVKDFLTKHPTSPLLNNSHLVLARAYFEEIGRFYRRQQFLRAIWSYSEFRKAIPKGVSLQAKPHLTMLEVGESYMRLGLYEKADVIFRELMKDPATVLTIGGEVTFRLAQSALLSGKLGAAKGLADRFVRRFPNGKRSASIRAILGEIAWLEGKPRLAKRHLTNALQGQMDNDLRGRSLFIFSEASAQLFRFGESVEALRKAIALYPQIPGKVKPFSLEKAKFRLGDLLYEGRQRVNSLVAYKDALEAYPKSKLVGWALHRTRRIQNQLKLTSRLSAQVSAKPRAAAPSSDPFWRQINQVRTESANWDKVNGPRLEEILGSKVVN